MLIFFVVLDPTPENYYAEILLYYYPIINIYVLQ